MSMPAGQIHSISEKPAFRRDQLENDLRQQIQQRQNRFDEPLGTESQLAEDYNLSRNTIRKVLQKLQNEGLLTRKTGFGTFVVPPEERPVSKVTFRRILLLTHWQKEDFYVQRLAAGILEYAYPRGADLDIINYDTLSAGALTAAFKALKFDAVIHDRPCQSQYALIGELAKNRIPQATINRQVPDVPALFVDHEDAIRRVVDFFSGLGLDRIAFVDMPWSEPLFADRQKFFIAELARKGIPEPEKTVFISQQKEDPAESFKKYFEQHNDLKAFFIVRPFVKTALEVFSSLGKNVPEDISVIMLDEDQRNPLYKNFSVYREPIQQLGFMATDAVFRCHSRAPFCTEKTLLPGELVVRNSCRYPFSGRTMKG